MTDLRRLLGERIWEHLECIDRLCEAYQVPMSRVTLILRDPANDAMSLIISNEANVEEAFRVVRSLLEREEDL